MEISQIEKIEQKIRKKPIPKNISFQEAKRLLEHYECVFSNGGGSHYTISSPISKFPVTIADHSPEPLKRYNIKDIISIIDQIKDNDR